MLLALEENECQRLPGEILAGARCVKRGDRRKRQGLSFWVNGGARRPFHSPVEPAQRPLVIGQVEVALGRHRLALPALDLRPQRQQVAKTLRI